jgi:hypothetical protein
MTKMDVTKLAAIPFLNHAELPGRFLCSSLFYDGEWHAWIEAGDQMIKVQMWPAETLYFGTQAERKTDLCLRFLNLIAQRLSCYPLGKKLFALRVDVCNLAASLAKIQLLHRSRKEIPHGVSRMVATEIEYLHSVCRSIFDLWQEVVATVWDGIKLLDTEAKKRQLKQSYAGMLFSSNKPRTTQALVDWFGIPPPLAECYTRSTAFFTDLREFRDRILHQGGEPPPIFDDESGFLVSAARVPFRGLDIWRPEERHPNDLVPLLPVLNYAIYRTLAICDEFGRTIEGIFQLPPPIVPNFWLQLRGYFDEVLVGALEDIDTRLHPRSASNAT